MAVQGEDEMKVVHIYGSRLIEKLFQICNYNRELQHWNENKF